MLIKLLITMLLSSVANFLAAETAEPEDIISSITQEIINEIKSKPDLASGNLGSINELVDKKVMPVLDFEKMTSLAVGKEWRSATESQKSSLMKGFRQLLLLTYSGTIKFAEEAKVKILPPRGKRNNKNVVVKTRVSVPGRQAVPINYRMKMTADGWKIYDLNVLGLWLLENYRVQFSQIISSYGIDGLIKEIDEKNFKLLSKRNS